MAVVDDRWADKVETAKPNDQGRASDAAKLHGQCTLAKVGEEPLCGVTILRSVLGEPVLRVQSELAIIDERDIVGVTL